MSQEQPTIRAKMDEARRLFQERRLPEARDLYQQICQIDRGNADAWFGLGLVNGLMGSMAEAIDCCREAVAVRPDFAAAHFNLARAAQLIGRSEEALQGYRRALDINPHWPEALNNLGSTLHELGKLNEAKVAYEQALIIKGDYAEALVNLGNVLKLQGRAAEAVTHYRRALEINPANTAAYKYLGSALIMNGQLDDALACYRQAARLDPSDLGMIAAEATILERQGLTDQAYAVIKPHVDAGSTNLEIANAFAELCEPVGRCDEAIDLLEGGLVQDKTVIGRERRILAHFHLGRLYDRRKIYDKAFSNFKAGNDLKPHVFDGEGFTKFISALIDTFDADFMRTAPRAGHGSQRPIFIVGMPRSGTSLVEQVLSSHPQVRGGGELEDIRNIVFSVSALLGSPLPYPQSVRGLTAEACDRMALRYLERLMQISPDARFVTDKMPQNFLGLGLIALLFPETRIIHCTRDPLDTCLSCYFYDFAGFHPYVYRLENLGLYYRQYQRLMRHWQAVLPIPVLNVSYEAMVADQERVSRELLAFCDLEWDERCLRFYESDRVVLTSSYQQVRKPIYKDSLQRWRHYEPYLEPLKKALAES
jgi:tetratricopeptide (TPR) repeat protein